MADLRIVDAPLLSTVKGTEKIPTGGEGNFSISVNQVADFAKLKWVLATEGYVDNAVGNVQADLNLHKNNESNPHNVTKTQVGLSNVDNTADLDKPLSNATQSAIITANSGKADKIYVDNALLSKSDKTYVDSQLILKVNKVEVDSSLLTKADKIYVDNQLALKSDKTEIVEQLLLKSDKTYVDSTLLTKADKTYTDSQLALKADKTYVDSQDLSLQSQIDQKVEAEYVDNALSNLSTVASKFYPTLAEANADIANLAVNQVVNIGEVVNGGLWYKATAGATSLTKSPYDPLAQAKIYTNSKVAKGLNDFQPTTSLADYYIQFDGNSATMAGWQQTKFPIVAGKKYRLVATLTSPPLPNGSWTQFGAYMQSKGLTLNSTNRLPATLALLAANTVAGSYVHSVDVDINPAADAQYLIVSQKPTDTVKLYEYYDLEPRLDNIEAQLPQIATNNNRIGVVESDLKNKAAVLSPTVTNALYLNYVGTANNDANYELRRYQINEGDLVFVDGQLTAAVDSGSATTVGILGFYTGTSLGSLVAGSLITQTEGTTKTYSYTLIAPAGSMYMNVSVKKGVDVVVAKKSLNLTPVNNRFQNIITLWGDSITWGSAPEDNVTWAQRLQTLIGKRATVLNCGIGGDGIWQISARAGAIPAVNNADFTLPSLASETVQVGSMTNYIYNGFFKTSYGNSKDVIFLYQGETGRWESIKTVNPIYVDGIECTLSVNKVDSGNMTWFLKRNVDTASPRTIYAKTPFYTNGAKAIKSIASVFWMGTNESFTGGVIDLDVYVDVLKRNIQYQGVSRCVVVGVYGGTGISGMSIAQLEAMEARMQKEFGSYYFNIRKYVTTNALADAGITPTQADTDAITLGKCPPSLLADGLHPNAAFSALIAKKVFEKLEMQGGIYNS